MVACAAGEEEVNKRQDKRAQLTDFNKVLADKEAAQNADANPEKGKDPAQAPVETITLPTLEVKMPALKLAADATLAGLKPADVILVNKISANELMIFGKDGKSWHYKPAAAAGEQLKAIDPIVVNPMGSTLYSLPDGQFWFVSADKLGRHKAQAPGDMMGAEKTVTVEQFSTATFLGDKSKIKVLFAVADEIILHLDNHIAIVTILPAPAPAQIKQLPIEKLPVDLKGEIQAGRSADGYWFRSAAGLFFLSKTVKTDVSPWSKSVLAVEPAAISSLAMWPDPVNAKFVGASVVLSAGTLVSDSATQAPAAP